MRTPQFGEWRTSGYTNSEGGNCVEVAPGTWRTSSYSNSTGGACVEVAPGLRCVGVRDSKRRAAGRLTVSAPAWRAFVAGVKGR